MSKIEDFLTSKEEKNIIEAIRLAESNTSGEIRVHIERSSKIDTIKRALEVFSILKMNNTKLQNAVLIYIAVDDHNFVIYGDHGINTVVPDNFWDTTKQDIQIYFNKGQFSEGLIKGITLIGRQLKQYFPWSKNDTNELPNSISKS